MVFDRTVIAKCGIRDRLGRDICKILLDGRDVNLEQVKTGMAWWSKANAREQSTEDRSAYEQAQFWAQARRLGLWSESKPSAARPWRRTNSRKMTKTAAMPSGSRNETAAVGFGMPKRSPEVLQQVHRQTRLRP
jgi:endonuclease YncB( thermonuclease family)